MQQCQDRRSQTGAGVARQGPGQGFLRTVRDSDIDACFREGECRIGVQAAAAPSPVGRRGCGGSIFQNLAPLMAAMKACGLKYSR